jgi:TAP-like protein
MFPDRVRAMAVDGVLDPVAWAKGRGDAGTRLPLTTRVRASEGSWEALTSAFAECDRVDKRRCPLAGESTAKWLEVVQRLKRGPVVVDGQRLSYPDLVGITLESLYGRASYRPLMGFIRATHRDLFGSAAAQQRSDAGSAYARLRQLLDERGPIGPYGAAVAAPDALFPSVHGVACSDSVNPRRPRAWVEVGVQHERRWPWFGRQWTWASSVCAQWPSASADVFRGPFEVTTSAPVLVIGNLHDPATPISGARVLNSLLEGSRLLTLDGWGHGALGQSSCVTSRVRDYLVAGALPPSGLVCEQDVQLYPRRRS